MSFEARQQQISFLLGKKIYNIPRNQRKYVWGEDNWKNLLEDLDFLRETGKYHFLGSIVLNSQPNPNNDDIEYYEIVDGQQRITTVILILIVIAQIFKERHEDALFQGLLPYIQTTSINNQTSCILHTDVHSCIMNLVSCIADKDTPYNTLQLLITNFLKHYITHKYGTAGVTKDRAVYDVIKKHTNVGDVNRLFCDLKLKAKYYQQIVCENNPHGDQITEIDRVLKFMLSNRNQLFRPIYLSLLHQAELGNISEDKLVKILKCIQYFFVCYNLISKETSKKISEGIQKYAYLIENEYSNDVLKDFLKHLKEDEYKHENYCTVSK